MTLCYLVGCLTSRARETKINHCGSNDTNTHFHPKDTLTQSQTHTPQKHVARRTMSPTHAEEKNAKSTF